MKLQTMSGRSLSKLGLGASRIGSIGNPTPISEIRRTLGRAFDLGINVFDTADIYGQGDSEREIGNAVRARREDCFVVTKIGQRFSTGMRLIRPLKPLLKPIMQASSSTRSKVVAQRAGVMQTNFEPRYLRQALERSLRRLRLDRVDAILLHGPTAETVTRDGVLRALADAKRSGLVRYFGVSCDDVETANQVLESPEIDLVQLPVTLLSTDLGCDLGNGFQSRSIAVFAREVIRLHPELAPAEAVSRYAARTDIASTIVGVSSVRHLEQIFAATSEKLGVA